MNIFNLSFGKDSMATLILAAEQGIPIDRVMYVEVKFNDEISGEHPIMAEWIPTAEKRLKELFGVTVEHLYYGKTFQQMFFQPLSKGKYVGCLKGFPLTRGAWCNHLKTDTTRRVYSDLKKRKIECVSFLGIAADEPNRWARKVDEMKSGKVLYRSLLVEQGLTENDAMEICKKYDLLSPLYNYEDTYRGGVLVLSQAMYGRLVLSLERLSRLVRTIAKNGAVFAYDIQTTRRDACGAC